MDIGKNIVKIRKDNNLTQDDLANKYSSRNSIKKG